MMSKSRMLSLVPLLLWCTQPGADDAGLTEPGADIYMANCVACHQPEGEGIEPVFPALAGSEYVAGAGSEVAAVISNGRAAMPAFQQDLSVAEIAAVATYIRQSWGNGYSGIDISTVEESMVRMDIDETARARDDDF